MSELSSSVSVIIATHNAGRTIEACLQSIRSQTYGRIEIIVVDNDSTDDTYELAEHNSDLLVRYGPERSAQRNHGARLAHGSYLLFVDADMRLTPQVVYECFLSIQKSRTAAVIVPEVSVGEGFLAKCRALERSCYTGDDGIESARFFDSTAFLDVGGFDEQLTAAEDRDLTIRIGAGARLPRTESYIIHDEGRLRLSSVLAKRRYYGATSIHYWRKHGRPTLRQANLVFRPAFIRNWRRFARHPLLACGVLSLKSLETAAVAWGLFGAWFGYKVDRGTQTASHV